MHVLETYKSTFLDINEATVFYPAVACWALDNQGSAAHLCLAISNRSRHKCRKCLINSRDINYPGSVACARDFQSDKLLAIAAQKALVKQWKGTDRLTQREQLYIRDCVYRNIQKIPVTYNARERVCSLQDPYMSCPYDDLHTLSEGLMKSWVIWTVICLASVANLDSEKFELSLHTMDSLLMSFPSVMIPEILRRHRFPKVN